MMLFIFLLFAAVNVQAQDPDFPDSTIESPPPVIEEMDEYDEYKEDQEDQEKKPPYFLPKSTFSTKESFELRKVPGDGVEDLKTDKAFWYADAEIIKRKVKTRTLFFESTLFRTLIWLIIIGGFVSFLVVYLSGSSVGLFRKKDRITIKEEEELLTEDIFAINYQKEIDKAAAQGNFRLAVRLMYLRLLKNLSEKNIIRYTQDKTNFDYLLQLHPTPYYKDFFRITRHYEYSWYGQFDVTENTYRVIRQDVDHFEREFKLY